MRLSSLAYLEGFYYKPRVDHEILATHAGGLVCLCACLRGRGAAADLLEGDRRARAAPPRWYRDMFGAENYFLEIQNHGSRDREDRGRAGSWRWRRSGHPGGGDQRLPLPAPRGRRRARRAAVHPDRQDGGRPDRMRYATDQLYFKSPEEMAALFADAPEALAQHARGRRALRPEARLRKPLLPAFPCRPRSRAPRATCASWRARASSARYPRRSPATMEQRLEYELDVICRMGFASYFLIVRDFIDFARQRGSAWGRAAARWRARWSPTPRHHRHRSARARADLRALPQSRARDHARHRHRLRRREPRRGDRVREAEVRRGERHARSSRSARWAAKGVVRDVGRALGHGVRRGRPDREAGARRISA